MMQLINKTNLSKTILNTKNLNSFNNKTTLSDNIQSLIDTNPSIRTPSLAPLGEEKGSTGILFDYLKSQKSIDTKPYLTHDLSPLKNLEFKSFPDNKKNGLDKKGLNKTEGSLLSFDQARENIGANKLVKTSTFKGVTQQLSYPVLREGNKNTNPLSLINSLPSPLGARGEDKTPNLSVLRKETDLGSYLKKLIKFDRGLANNQIVMYQFNKGNTKAYNFLFDKASKLLKLNFLSMGCLISRPVFRMAYFNNEGNLTQKILIDLSYFIRKNKNRYLNNKVEVNNNILHISHPDNEINPLKQELDLSISEIDNTKLGNKIIQVSQRNNILCKYNNKFQFLTDYLNSIARSEVELDLVRLPKSSYDSNILVQDLALKSYKYRFVKLVSRLFSKVHIQKLDYSKPLQSSLSFPSYLSGINIKLAGRTFRQRVIPRMTVKRVQKGSLTNVNVQFIDKARFTGKTRRGSFSFTVTLGHVFF